MEKIKNILNSSAGILVELDDIENSDRKIIDNRFTLIKKEINSISNKDDVYYSNLIKLFANYINELYDKKTTVDNCDVYDKNGNVITPVDSFFDTYDKIRIGQANRALTEKLFDYACSILKNNEDVKLDVESLKKLFNKDPKRFELTAEVSYIYRNLNFNKLAKILNKNNTLKKSDINIDQIYDVLISTCQILDLNIFKLFIDKKDYEKEHKKIDDLLKHCNSKTFVSITSTILNNYDKNLDILSIIKERDNADFTSAVICKLLETTKEKNIDLIHKILNDNSIKLDYDYSYGTYFGTCSLKADIAKSNNKIIIKDLLSKDENIEDCYWDGEFPIYLYRLYAIIGEYEKSLELFEKQYSPLYDFTDNCEEKGFKYGDVTYEDSLNNYVEKICTSLKDDKMDYEQKKEIIYRILKNKEVIYINLYDFANSIKEVLTEKDFNEFLESLMHKYNEGSIIFINVEENFEGFYSERYIIKPDTKEEVNDTINVLKKNHKK